MLLGKLSIINMEMPVLKNLVQFQKSIKTRIEDFNSAQKLLIDEFKIETKNRMLQIDEHPQRKLILSKLEELNNVEYDVEGSNFMTEDAVFDASQKTMNVNEISELLDVLVEYDDEDKNFKTGQVVEKSVAKSSKK